MGFLKNQIRNVLWHTPFARLIYPRLQYNFTPAQLCFLCNCIDQTSHLPGPIFDIGCYAGYTTVWLNRHMGCSGIEKPYIAIDTFSGFTMSDIQYEVQKREKGKSERQLRKSFSSNSKKRFDRILEINQITRVRSFQADAGFFDYTPYHDISFALIDVDLYLSVKRTLERIWPQMAYGGIIVIDDCAHGLWCDGALCAYSEFTDGKKIRKQIVHGKLGVIKRVNGGQL